LFSPRQLSQVPSQHVGMSTMEHVLRAGGVSTHDITELRSSTALHIDMLQSSGASPADIAEWKTPSKTKAISVAAPPAESEAASFAATLREFQQLQNAFHRQHHKL